jgi:hypothetical protein
MKKYKIAGYALAGIYFLLAWASAVTIYVLISLTKKRRQMQVGEMMLFGSFNTMTLLVP